MLEYMDGCGDKLSKEHTVDEGVLRGGCGVGCVPFMEVNDPAVLCKRYLNNIQTSLEKLKSSNNDPKFVESML